MYIRKISGLQNFYLNSLIKSKTFIASSILSFILPLITLLIMYFIGYNLLASSYIYSIVLISICTIQIIIISIILFANPIADSTDLVLISKAIKRSKLFKNKCIITGIFLLMIFFVQTIITIIFTCIVSTKWDEILAYSLITFFAQIIVASFLMPIIFWSNFNFSKVISISINIILLFIIVGSSFLSHFVLPDSSQNNQLINNADYKMSYSQLVAVDKDGNQVDDMLVINQNISNSKINANTNYKNNLNNVSAGSNFMPGEWIMSPFQSIYMAAKYTNDFPLIANGAVDEYKLGLVRFYNQEIVNINSLIKNEYSYLPIRVEDQSIFNLNVVDLNNLLINDIEDIINSAKDVINFKNENQLNNFISKINNNQIVWDQNFSAIEINTIKALVGLDGKHPSLYYAFKYKDFIQGKLNSFYSSIKNQVSSAFSKIYEIIFTNSYAYIAILNNTNNSNFIDSIYPSIETINEAMPAAKSDLTYFKDILITWNNNQSSILLNDNTRRNIVLSNMGINKNINITNKQEWINFINTEATTLASLKIIYDELKLKLLAIDQPKLVNVNYAANYVDIKQYSYASIIGQQSWLDYSYIYMIFLMLLSAMLFNLSYRRYLALAF